MVRITASRTASVAGACGRHAARPRFWEAHNNAGIALARMGRMREAVERFEQAAKLAPGDPEVQDNRLSERNALATTVSATEE